jgi:hypothetical protein
MREGRLRTVVSIAEIISALAVVVTLIYAVSELKRSQLLTSSNIETILYDRMLELDRLTVEAEGLAEILTRAHADPESLNPVERARFLAFEHIFYDAWEAAVEAWKSDLMDEETFRSWDDYFAADAARRTKLAWTGNLRHYNGGFIDYVEFRVNWDR